MYNLVNIKTVIGLLPGGTTLLPSMLPHHQWRPLVFTWGRFHWIFEHSMTSPECDGVSNHRWFGCLVNKWFRLTVKKTSQLGITDYLWGKPTGDHGFPSWRVSNAKIISTLWKQHQSARHKNTLKLKNYEYLFTRCAKCTPYVWSRTEVTRNINNQYPKLLVWLDN